MALINAMGLGMRCITHLPKEIINLASFALVISISNIAYTHDYSIQEVMNESSMQSLGLEDLMDIKVTSVAKKQQSLSNSAAAIYVITQEDIQRSGVTTIPEALRMAPGIHVARIDSNKWAITSRGFTGRFANKLLVMIDGRTVYTPAYSGVFWEVQDTLMEDIERIEVIRGPGATLWGANAVNGVINIITKSALETQGGLLTIGAGTYEEKFSSIRYGTQLSDNSFARWYIKGNERGEFEFENKDQSANDDWQMWQTGGRIDSHIDAANTFTLQGDYYEGKIQDNQFIPIFQVPYYQTANETTLVSGGNLLARWQHTPTLSNSVSVQFYYDNTSREENFTEIKNEIFDLDFQHHFEMLERHDVVWGFGYRHTSDNFQRTSGTIDPLRDTINLTNIFIQDEITLLPNSLWLTIGSKFEHNHYTHWEIQPSVRLFWDVNSKHKLWTSISKAVRTPSRHEYNSRIIHGVLPPFTGFNNTNSFSAYEIIGNKEFDAENVIAYEIGYRVSPNNKISIDTTIFYNEYTDLQGYKFSSQSTINGIVLYSVPITNNRTGYTSGFEVASNFLANDWWTIDVSYSFFNENINTEATDVLVSKSPKNTLSIRSNMSINESVDFNLWFKYVDDNQVLNHIGELVTIDAYSTLDAKLTWKLNKQTDIALVGQNLLESKHIEYIDTGIFDSVALERGFYVKINWKF